jgi:hypothetical protein
MPEYIREEPETIVVERRGMGAGAIVGILVLAVIALVAVLFVTGFWSVKVNPGSLPEISVTAKGGTMPDVDANSKELVVGTKSTTVDVPTVGTKKTDVNVPVVGVKDDDKKQ